MLTRGETLLRGTKDTADAVERDALAAAPAGQVIHGLIGDLDDVKRTQHTGDDLEAVIDSVLIVLERVQRRGLAPLADLITALGQPVAVDLAGPTWDEVEQPGGGKEFTSQINHPGQLLRSAPSWVAVMPHVLVYAQDLHALKPSLIFCSAY